MGSTVEQICKNCTHWEKSNDRHALRKLGGCDCKKYVYGYNVFGINVDEDGVHVENDEGWGFYTGPEFGCVHWTNSPKGE